MLIKSAKRTERKPGPSGVAVKVTRNGPWCRWVSRHPMRHVNMDHLPTGPGPGDTGSARSPAHTWFGCVSTAPRATGCPWWVQVQVQPGHLAATHKPSCGPLKNHLAPKTDSHERPCRHSLCMLSGRGFQRIGALGCNTYNPMPNPHT